MVTFVSGDTLPAMTAAAQISPAPFGAEWTIAKNGYEAVIVEIGGGLRAFGHNGLQLLDGFPEGEMCYGSAGQILAPWPNRIRDGQYIFGGKKYQLPLSDPCGSSAIHGLVSWTRWNLVEISDDRVVIEHDLVPEPGYPWPLKLSTTWSVGECGLRVDHKVINIGFSPSPFGLGVHPYLLSGNTVDDTILHISARSHLLLDDRGLPIGFARVAGGAYDFTLPRPIGTTRLDVTFGDVERDICGVSAATIAATDGSEICVWADKSFGWWQVYTGDTLPGERHRRSVALEPMTCPPDAFRSGKDVVVLRPGDVWKGSWGIRKMLM